MIAVALLALTAPTALAGWKLIDRVPGIILDADTERILFLDTGGTLKVKDRATQAMTTVSLPPGDVAQYGYLTPRGAIFVADGPDTIDEHVYEWRDGSLIDLGFPNSANSLVVAGNYAIWSGNSIPNPLLYRRDLDTGTTITVSTNAANGDNDVAANGDVVFFRPTDYEVLRYRAGVTTQLTSDSSRWNTTPLTDGINVVFRNTSPCCGPENGSIAIHTAAGQQITLDSYRSGAWPQPGQEYAAAGGWVAYTKAGSGPLEVWTRSPGGVHRQASPPGTDTWIAGLNHLGEVILHDRLTNREYFSRPGAPVVDLGPSDHYAPDFLKWLNGRWYARWRGALGELDNATYARPKGATPIRTSLAVAYRPCESPNREHGPPLAFPACASPRPASDHLTVGTADANPNPAGFQGHVRLDVTAGDPTTTSDEADVRFDVDVIDVRRAADLTDFTGELEARLPVALTDRDNTGTLGSGPASIQNTAAPVEVTTSTAHGLTTGAQVGITSTRGFVFCALGVWRVTVTGTHTFTLDDSGSCNRTFDETDMVWKEYAEVGPSAATAEPVSVTFPVPCAATIDQGIGARCGVATTADAVVPGSVPEGGRVLWQLGAVELYDGGADGDADTGADNTLFARQGVFVP